MNKDSYKSIIENIKIKSDNSDYPDRWEDISKRKDKSELDAIAWKKLAVDSAYDQKWRSTILNKGPIEIATYPMLIEELRPKTIFELGALHGGGAIWMADICDLFGIETKIISLDIDLSLLSNEARADSRINFIEGDVFKIDELDSLAEFESYPHPWLVIDDCHFNTAGILSFVVRKGARIGDYIIVEDTNLDAWDAWADHWMDSERVENGKQKIVRMREWLSHNSDWKVDTKYVDFFGYNVTKNWNSVLKKVSS